MGLSYELDLSGYTDREQIEAGDNVPVGWYRAVVDEHYEDHNREGTFVFVFKVNGGLYGGKKLFYRVQDPRLIDDEQKAKYARNRIATLASRFGLIGDGDMGKANTAVDFDKTEGMEMVVRVVEQKTERGTFYNVGYADVYPLDHHKIPKDARAGLQLPPAREPNAKSSGPAPAPANRVAGKKDDFADL